MAPTALEALAMIRDDMETDVRTFEGATFTGGNVSVMFGNLAAAVQALAAIVTEHIEQCAAAREDLKGDAQLLARTVTHHINDVHHWDPFTNKGTSDSQQGNHQPNPPGFLAT